METWTWTGDLDRQAKAHELTGARSRTLVTDPLLPPVSLAFASVGLKSAGRVLDRRLPRTQTGQSAASARQRVHLRLGTHISLTPRPIATGFSVAFEGRHRPDLDRLHGDRSRHSVLRRNREQSSNPSSRGFHRNGGCRPVAAANGTAQVRCRGPSDLDSSQVRVEPLLSLPCPFRE